MNQTIYFPSGQGSLGVTVRECGYQKTLPDQWLPKPRVFSAYVLSYIATGSAWYENGSSKRQLMPEGSCVIFFPGLTSFYSPCDKQKWEEYWIHFQGPYGRLLESEGILRPDRPVYHLNQSRALLKMFQAALTIALDRSEEAQLRLSGQLLHILNEMLMIKKESAVPLSSAPLSALIKQIQQNPEIAWDFHAEAVKLGMTYSFLFRQFKKVAGRPPHQFVNVERMKLACQFLSKGLSVQESCFRVGMEDPFHFSRLFKQIMGDAPLNYRLKGP